MTNPSSEAELREKTKSIIMDFACEQQWNGLSLKRLHEGIDMTVDKLLDLIHQRERQARKEVKEEVLDTVMGIDARFNPSPSDVRNKIIKAIESLEVED